MRYTPKTQEQITEDIVAWTVAGSGGKISDMTDSSSVLHFIVAHARQLSQLYFQGTLLRDTFDLAKCFGEDLDDRAKEIGGLTRLLGKKAVGQVVLSRRTNVGTAVAGAGVVVSTAGGVTVVTTGTATASPGFFDSNPVAAIALVGGDAGNVAPGALMRFSSRPPGFDTVSNPLKFTQGRDKESDDELKQRIADYINSLARCHLAALAFAAKNVALPSGARVVFAKAFNNIERAGFVTIYIDDGAGTTETTSLNTPTVGAQQALSENVTFALSIGDDAVGGEEFLFLNNKPVKEETLVLRSDSRPGPSLSILTPGTDYLFNPTNSQIKFTPALVADEEIDANYTFFTGLIQEVQKVIDGDPADETNYPGWAAGGIRARVLAPTRVAFDIEGQLLVSEGYDREVAKATARANVLAYTNNLGISGDSILNEIIERIMITPGVYDLKLNLPIGNRMTRDNELVILDPSNVNFT